ncbi:MAG TPA: 1-phosphofructokinase family hexose kinase [Sphingomonadaceae bacterium]
MSGSPTIVTLAMNPAIDADFEVEQVAPLHKLRCSAERYQPGGGGINVASVIVRLGGTAVCHYISGGATGATLERLLDRHAFAHRAIPVAGSTRIACNVVETATGREFRFVPPGPTLAEPEWRGALAALEEAQGEWLVASGSLPPGAPDDFYARVARVARNRGMRVVLDTSHEPLREGLAAGSIHLVKPSEEELEQFVGRKLSTLEEIGGAAMEIVAAGHAELVAVTLGAEGGILAARDGWRGLPAFAVEARSAVGAGDSFVAAMVLKLALGWAAFEAFRYGMAAGAAAVMTPGTEMCHPADVERLYRESLAKENGG